MKPQQKTAFRKALLTWYSKGHRDFPWRRTRDPYAILVSEVMLQQTQAERVEPKYLEWLKRYPDFASLAAAPLGDVIRAWSGLGYNRRAVQLHGIAKRVVAESGGALPGEFERLRSFKGLGDYTAAAIACFAFDGRRAVVDTNVRRVLERVFLGGREGTAKRIDELAQSAIPARRAYDWNQGMMELGAMVCLSREPRCAACPVYRHCRAAPTIHRRLAKSAQGKARVKDKPFKESRRYYRGRIVEYLRARSGGDGATLAELGRAVKKGEGEREWVADLVQGLERDGLVKVRNNRGQVRVGLP